MPELFDHGGTGGGLRLGFCAGITSRASFQRDIRGTWWQVETACLYLCLRRGLRAPLAALGTDVVGVPIYLGVDMPRIAKGGRRKRV